LGRLALLARLKPVRAEMCAEQLNRDGATVRVVAQDTVAVSALACSDDDGEQGARWATRSLTPLSAPNADESPPPDKTRSVSRAASR
jgi:hypothetical protein